MAHDHHVYDATDWNTVGQLNDQLVPSSETSADSSMASSDLFTYLPSSPAIMLPPLTPSFILNDDIPSSPSSPSLTAMTMSLADSLLLPLPRDDDGTTSEVIPLSLVDDTLYVPLDEQHYTLPVIDQQSYHHDAASSLSSLSNGYDHQPHAIAATVAVPLPVVVATAVTVFPAPAPLPKKVGACEICYRHKVAPTCFARDSLFA